MVGVPVIINHKDLNKNNADDERVGVVNSVWYDEKDGWYWCDGIIWDETAQNLITDKNWSVSCSYDVKTADDKGGTENNIKYDMEFLDGVFTHLALVNNPRYERANIVFNAKPDFANQFKNTFYEALAEVIVENCLGEIKNSFPDHEGRPGKRGGSLPKKEAKSKETGSNFFKKWNNAPTIKLKPPTEWSKIQDIKELRNKVKEYLSNITKKTPLERKGLGVIRFSNKSIDEYISYSADKDKLLAAFQIPDFIKQGILGEYFDSAKDRSKQDTIKGFYPIYFNLKTSTTTKKAEILIGKDNNGNLFFDMFLDYDREKANKKGF